MKWNIKKISLTAFAVLAIGLIGTMGLANAYQGNPNNHGPNYDTTLHDMKTDAFNANDYETWKFLMEQNEHQGRVLEVVNEDNFNLFVEAHNAALEGNMEKANSIRAEVGLNNGVGPKDGTGHRMRGYGNSQHQGQGRLHQ